MEEEDPVSALAARLGALEQGFTERLEKIEAFIERVSDEDDKEREAIGLQKAEEAREIANEDYLSYRKRTIGV